MKITVSTVVDAPLQTVWDAWVTPADITQWNFASDDWCCPRAEVDLQPGGVYSSRMEAKDGSMGFDFVCEITAVEPAARLCYKMEDGREVEVLFQESAQGVSVTETFDAESENPAEMQQQGWQAILDSFARHAESKVA